MFRALGTVAASASAAASPSASGTATPVLMDAPLSANLSLTPHAPPKSPDELTPVELAIQSAAIFSVSVGASSKKTLASWHVQTPVDVVNSMLGLVNSESAPAPAAVSGGANEEGPTHK